MHTDWVLMSCSIRTSICMQGVPKCGDPKPTGLTTYAWHTICPRTICREKGNATAKGALACFVVYCVLILSLTNDGSFLRLGSHKRLPRKMRITNRSLIEYRTKDHSQISCMAWCQNEIPVSARSPTFVAGPGH